MALSVEIEKKLPGFHLAMQFQAGEETLALLGASGSGKSMTLQCIAGILRPDRGRIVLDGQVLFDSAAGIDLPPQARRTGLLFQNYALFPNMTVFQNLLAGARREPDRKKRRAAARDMAVRFGLEGLLDRRPAQLSGGEQQRVALARILISAPSLLLLDEPFSALDSHLRFRLEQEVRSVIRSFGKTVLLVSHDREEVFRMADNIAVVHAGRVEQIGSRAEVFRRPTTWAGAALTGCQNLSRAVPTGPDRARALDWGTELRLSAPAENVTAVGLRAAGLRPGQGENALLCRVEECLQNPRSTLVLLRSQGMTGTLVWETDRQVRVGEEIWLTLPPEEILPLGEAERMEGP